MGVAASPCLRGALGYSLVLNHPFADGNKCVGHAAMTGFLALNGRELGGSIDVAERAMLALAAGSLSRAQLVDWPEVLRARSG